MSLLHEYFAIKNLNARVYVPIQEIERISKSIGVNKHTMFLYIAVLTDGFQKELHFRGKNNLDAIIEIASAMKYNETPSDILGDETLVSKAYQLHEQFLTECKDYLFEASESAKNAKATFFTFLASIAFVMALIFILFYFKDTTIVKTLLSFIGE